MGEGIVNRSKVYFGGDIAASYDRIGLFRIENERVIDKFHSINMIGYR